MIFHLWQSLSQAKESCILILAFLNPAHLLVQGFITTTTWKRWEDTAGNGEGRKGSRLTGNLENTTLALYGFSSRKELPGRKRKTQQENLALLKSRRCYQRKPGSGKGSQTT